MKTVIQVRHLSKIDSHFHGNGNTLKQNEFPTSQGFDNIGGI
jgi:hypothetical protein